MISVSTDVSSGSDGVSRSLASVSARNTNAVIRKEGTNTRVVRNFSVRQEDGAEQMFIGEGENRYEVLLLLGQGSFGKVIDHPMSDSINEFSDKASGFKTIIPASGYINPKLPLLPIESKEPDITPAEPDTILYCLPILVKTALPERVTESSVRLRPPWRVICNEPNLRDCLYLDLFTFIT